MLNKIEEFISSAKIEGIKPQNCDAAAGGKMSLPDNVQTIYKREYNAAIAQVQKPGD